MDPAIIKAAIEALKNDDGAAALALLEQMIVGDEAAEQDPADGTDPAAAAADPPPADPAAPPVPVKPDPATNARLERLERQSQEAELTERRTLVASLVKCEAETPATAWEGKPEARKPVARLMTESLPDLRERVGKLVAARAKRGVPVSPSPAATSDGDEPALTADETAAIKKLGITADEFRARKAAAVRSRRTA